MLKPIKLLSIVLNLFDGEGGGASASTSASAAAGQAVAGQTGVDSKVGNSRQSSGEKVLYGKQAEQSDTTPAAEGVNKSGITTTTKATEDRKAAFESLIGGEYKDLFTERTQSIINNRFKETKTLEAELKTHQSIADVLKMKYNVTDNSKLLEAINNDSAYWEDAADEAGLSVEQFKTMKKLEADNAGFKQAQMDAQATDAANKQYQAWMNETDVMKAEFPEFDFAIECQNDDFIKLLRSGIDVKAAYTVLHLDEFKTNFARTTAKATETNVINNIRAKGNRPTENGVSSQPGVIVKSDVSKLTRADRQEIERRAMRGEKITF